MEPEVTVESVKEKSVRGIVVLTGRTFLLQVIALVAQLFLFAYLGKYEFGVFAIVSAIVNFLVYFSDIGLAAALIQKKEKPTETDLRTTFTVQQALILILIVLVFVFSPYIVSRFALTPDGRNLLFALAFSLLLSSLKSIPSVLLERKLEFTKLVFPQILEQVIYNVVLVTLAVNGMGLKSFSFAVLARGVVGLIAIYALQPWRPAVAFSRKTLSGLFKFGIPYQLNTFLATFKDDGVTLILGGILGPVGVGILSFAQKLARVPLTFFMDTVTRVTFPAFSRLQDEKSDLERSVTRSIFFICFLVFPSLIGIVLLAPILVNVIPRYNQWTPALIPLIFIAINFLFASATTQLTNLLNAIGRIKYTFYLMVMWTILTWIFVPFLAIRYGVLGASIGYAIVGASSVVAMIIAKRFVNFSIYHSIVKPAIGTLVMGALLIVMRQLLPQSFTSMAILIVAGGLIYMTTMFAIVGTSLVDDAKKSLGMLLPRPK